jgi:hypothetical protein
MQVGDVVSEAAVRGCSPLIFECEGVKCAVADGWGEFLGFILANGKAEVMSKGWSREWVVTALSGFAAERAVQLEPPSFSM